MADGVFNIAKGRANELVARVANDDPAGAGLVLVLLQAAEADAVLQDYDTLADVLAGANTEADFTNYARIELTAVADPTVDKTNNYQAASIGSQTWAAAGGAINNTLVKLLVCYSPDAVASTDADIAPLTHHDFTVTTDGTALVAQESASGFFRAS